MPSHRPTAPPPPPPSAPPPGLSLQRPSDITFHNLPPWTTPAAILLGVGVVTFFFSAMLMGLGESRANGKVEAWAKANGLEVIKTLVVKSDRGPFKSRPAWQTVSAATFRNRYGMNRSAWICWGNFFFLYWRQPTVTWDDEAGKRAS